MGLFDSFLKWVKARLHVRPTELRGAPGVSDPKAAADHVNQTVGSAIDGAAPLGVATVENALHLHPDTLKGAPGIADHAAAADAINAIVKGKLEGS